MNGAMLAIIANRFEALARRMASALVRSGHSGVLNRAKDLSCCIVGSDHQLLAVADSIPMHVLSGPDLISRTLTEMHPRMQPGDAFLNNSPYHGCTHAADYTVIVPIFDEDDVLRMYVHVKAHQADIGNSEPTTYFATAKDVFNEGALIFPNTKIASRGELSEDFIRLGQIRIRSPEQWLGDVQAMHGAARLGEQGVHAIARSYGWQAIEEFARDWLAYGELSVRDAIKQLAPGTATAECLHDPMPGTPAEGVPARASVTIDAARGEIEVDFTNNIDCMQNGLNLSEACSRSAALIGVFNSLPGKFPKNAGSFRPIRIKLRENSAIGIPRHPASCSASTTNLADRAAAAVQLAMARMEGDFGMAEVGSVNPPSKGVISGRDWRNGRFVVEQLFLGSTGGAAHAQGDGWLTNSHVGNAGMGLVDSVELVEYCLPLVVDRRSLIQDSEGAGQYIGAPSLETVIGVTGGEINIVYASDCSVHPARGVRGGGPGTKADQLLVSEGATRQLPNCAKLTLREGDRVISVSAGGGGFGDPKRRSPESVAYEVAEGLLSPERALQVYGCNVPHKPSSGKKDK